MLNNLLAILPGDGSSQAGQVQSPKNFYFDNFGEAALYALIGLLIVFVGIVIIIGIIWLVGLIMRKTNNLEFLTKKKGMKPKAEDNTTLAPVSAGTAVEDGEIPDEVKVAIIGAIMAYYQEQEGHCEFTVKRIKRI